MSNMHIDTRPCKGHRIYPVYDRYRINETFIDPTATAPPRVLFESVQLYLRGTYWCFGPVYTRKAPNGTVPQ